MSVSVVLPAMGATAMLLDDNNKTCASYADAAVIVPKCAALEAALDEGSKAAAKTTTTAAAAAACTPTLRLFTVLLGRPLGPHERVGLTGDSKALGEWQLQRCVPMMATGDLEWRASVMLPPACGNTSYRYFVFVEDEQGRRQIRRWETQLKPRTLGAHDAACPQVDRFGEASEGLVQVNRGWLTSESIVQLKFEREKLFQVRDIDKFYPEDVQMRLLPLDGDLRPLPDPAAAAAAGLSVEVVKMQFGQSQLQPQGPAGVSYRRGEIVIFHVVLPDPQSCAFALLFHGAGGEVIGRAVIRPGVLAGSEGLLQLDVTDPSPEAKGAVIAQLSLPYLVVRPFSEAAWLDFRTTYAHYWPKSWPNLDVGHRGNGKSYIASPPQELENTLASFRRAHESLVDMIELDVHLTADGVPIIYHDFGVRTAPRGKPISDAAQLEYVLIKDLTYEALKQLRVFAVIGGAVREYAAHNEEVRTEHRLFPRLVDVLEGLPKTLGIDVEIKWPQRRACGEVEAEQTIDKNFFIDRVLTTVIRYGCGRPLVFSSFDADICTMLRFKQNLFPVMFLSLGESKKYKPFVSLRTRTFEQALNNAQAFELAGTAPHAADFLGEAGAEMMQRARQLGQIALVWGDDCNSPEAVAYFSRIGATATCYDRADLYVPPHKTRSFFDSTALMAQFEGRCRQ